MNILKEFTELHNGYFYENQIRSVPTFEGVLKSQKAISKIEYEKFRIITYGNFELGASMELLKDAPPYSFILIGEIDFPVIQIFPRGKLSRMFVKIFYRKNISEVDVNYKITNSIISGRINDNERLCTLLLRSNVYISRKNKSKNALKMFAIQSVMEIQTLEELHELLKELNKVLGKNS